MQEARSVQRRAHLICGALGLFAVGDAAVDSVALDGGSGQLGIHLWTRALDVDQPGWFLIGPVDIPAFDGDHVIHFGLCSTVSIGAVRAGFDGGAFSGGGPTEFPALNAGNTGPALEAPVAELGLPSGYDAMCFFQRLGGWLGRSSHTTCALADRRRHCHILGR